APADNVPGQRHKSIRLTVCGAEVNRNVPTFGVTGVFQGSAECRHQVNVKGLTVEKSDYRHCHWLGTHCKWPHCRRAANERDELAPCQLNELHPAALI